MHAHPEILGESALKEWDAATKGHHLPEHVKEHPMEHSAKEKAHFQRAMSHLHTGALHRHLGIAEGHPIPEEKKEEAAHSSNPHVAAMGRLALAMHHWSHDGHKA